MSSTRHMGRKRLRHGPPAATANVKRSYGRKMGAGLLLLLLAGGLWIALRPSFVKREGPKHMNSAPAATTHLPREAVPASASEAGHSDKTADYDQEFIGQINRGSELLAQGKPAEAVEVLTAAARSHPEDEDVHYNLALALTRLGRLEEAAKEYSEALRILPDYAEAHNNFGNLLLRMGQTEQAIAHFEKAVKLMPDYASAHNNFGTALQKAGRVDEATKEFAQATKLNPQYWEAHFNLAGSLVQERRLDEARQELEIVVRLRPDFPPAKAALSQLNANKPKQP